MLDVSVPDGSLAPIDDGNPGRSHFGGALPASLPTTSASYWRWANTPERLSTDASIDLSADSIVAYDDTVTPAPPTWEPTQVYAEGGTATLRSDWSADATMALVLGEHDTASEFGRDRTGQGRYPQSHEHADPGAFLLHAFGERLALDPGYLSFTDHGLVNQPEDHNIVLIDGQGPPDYLRASFDWAADPGGRPPAEGQSTLAHPVVSEAGDAVSVATAYRGAQIDRRVIFGADRYLVVADRVDAPAGADVSWMLHGNGGGTSGGTFEPSAVGGRWTIGGARLDSGIATTEGAPELAVTDEVHEGVGAARLTHSALAASTTAAGSPVGAIQLLYPTRSGSAPPTIERTEADGAVTLVATDPTDDREVTVVQRGDAERRPAGRRGLDRRGPAGGRADPRGRPRLGVGRGRDPHHRGGGRPS